jgi:hypothetical protein
VLGRFRQKNWQNIFVSWFMAIAVISILVGCSDRVSSGKSLVSSATSFAEVAAPKVISQLRQIASSYQPKVKIVSPKDSETLKDTTVEVRFKVEGLPIFKDSDLGLGSHLNVTVDDRPYREVYDLESPLILENLSPGTHTIRALANTAWNESFVNSNAYAQTTFHVLTKNEENIPRNDRYIITYNSPAEDYSANPLLLDFQVSQPQKPSIDVKKSAKIRATIDNESFIFEYPQPIYLQGLKPGKKVIKLEILDDKGQPIEDFYKDGLRVVDYQPNLSSALGSLLAGDISARQALKIIDPKYKNLLPEAIETPEPTPSLETVPSPTLTEPTNELPEEAKQIPPSEELQPELEPQPTDEIEEMPEEDLLAPEEVEEEEDKEKSFPDARVVPIPLPLETKTPEVPDITVDKTPQSKESPKGGFFNRFRREEPSSVSPTSPTPVLETPTPSPEAVSTPIPTVRVSPSPTPTPVLKVTPTPIPETKPTGELLEPLRRQGDTSPAGIPSPTPIVIPSPKAVIEPPKVETTPEPSLMERLRQRVTPKEETKPVVIPSPKPTPIVIPSPKAVIEPPKVETTPEPSLIDRLKRRSNPTPDVEVSPTPRVIQLPKIERSPEPNPKPETKPDFNSSFRRFFPTAAPRPQKETTPAEVKPEKVPVVEVTPETGIPSRYLQKTIDSEVNMETD